MFNVLTPSSIRFFLQQSKSVGSIQIGRVLNKNNIFDIMFQTINKACGKIAIVRTLLIGNKLINELTKLIYVFPLDLTEISVFIPNEV
jgi:hypothetical protein